MAMGDTVSSSIHSLYRYYLVPRKKVIKASSKDATKTNLQFFWRSETYGPICDVGSLSLVSITNPEAVGSIPCQIGLDVSILFTESPIASPLSPSSRVTTKAQCKNRQGRFSFAG